MYCRMLDRTGYKVCRVKLKSMKIIIGELPVSVRDAKYLNVEVAVNKIRKNDGDTWELIVCLTHVHFKIFVQPNTMFDLCSKQDEKRLTKT